MSKFSVFGHQAVADMSLCTFAWCATGHLEVVSVLMGDFLSGWGVLSSVLVRLAGPATRAQAPIDDFGLVDGEAVVVACRQAGASTDRAVDVDDPVALSADQVMVVVVDAVLVTRRGSHRLNATQKPAFAQRVQRVVHRLARDRTNVLAHQIDDVVGCCFVRRSREHADYIVSIHRLLPLTVRV